MAVAAFDSPSGEMSDLATPNVTEFARDALDSEVGVHTPDLDEDDEDDSVKGFTGSRG